MTVYALTSRVVDGSGQVVAITMSPFLVLDPGEDTVQAEAELARVAAELIVLKADLEAARHNTTHPHHHWWRL